MEALMDATIEQINALHSTEDVLRAVVEGDKIFSMAIPEITVTTFRYRQNSKTPLQII
jgi:hypothetical protein